MPVQLLPFQKVVDMPVSQKRRCEIYSLAIASIVFVSTILVLFVFGMIFSGVFNRTTSLLITSFVGIPFTVILLVLVYTSSAISFRNTDKWVSTDVCCNLMRSQPTCCTKSCGGNKHSCAKMSCLHFAVSVWAILCFFVVVTMLSTGCNQEVNSSYGYYSHHYYSSEYYTTTDRTNYRQSRIVYGCAFLAGFEVPLLLLMVSLAATTTISAYLLRQIEQGQPEIEDLPAGKMVVQACPDNAMTELTPYSPPFVTAHVVDAGVGGAEAQSLLNGASTNNPAVHDERIPVGREL